MVSCIQTYVFEMKNNALHLRIYVESFCDLIGKFDE